MGISSQQFRITTGCFNPNLIFSYKLCKPKYKFNPRYRSKSRHKISMFKLLCFLFLCYCNCEIESGFSSQKSHDKSYSKWSASSFPESEQILPAPVPNYYLKTQCEASGPSANPIFKEPNLFLGNDQEQVQDGEDNVDTTEHSHKLYYNLNCDKCGGLCVSHKILRKNTR